MICNGRGIYGTTIPRVCNRIKRVDKNIKPSIITHYLQICNTIYGIFLITKADINHNILWFKGLPFKSSYGIIWSENPRQEK